MIALPSRYSDYMVHWGVASPEACPLIWCTDYPDGDPGYATMWGYCNSILPSPQGAWFKLDDHNPAARVADIAAKLAIDLVETARWCEPFRTRRQLRDYLLDNYQAHAKRGFFVPGTSPLTLYTAAVLAALDHDPTAPELARRAAEELRPLAGGITDERLSRLSALLLQEQ